jgi:hypothetical protein
MVLASIVTIMIGVGSRGKTAFDFRQQSLTTEATSPPNRRITETIWHTGLRRAILAS